MSFDEDRDDDFDSSEEDSDDLERASEYVLEDSFYGKEIFVPKSRSMFQHFDLEDNPLNDLNDQDPDALGSQYQDSQFVAEEIYDGFNPPEQDLVFEVNHVNTILQH